MSNYDVMFWGSFLDNVLQFNIKDTKSAGTTQYDEAVFDSADDSFSENIIFRNRSLQMFWGLHIEL